MKCRKSKRGQVKFGQLSNCLDLTCPFDLNSFLYVLTRQHHKRLAFFHTLSPTSKIPCIFYGDFNRSRTFKRTEALTTLGKSHSKCLLRFPPRSCAMILFSLSLSRFLYMYSYRYSRDDGFSVKIGNMVFQLISSERFS